MADFGMNRNASGYRDDTAYKAFMGMAKPGDVWTAKDGRQKVLILKNQGSFCNCLRLLDNQVHQRCIEVNSAETMYTDPAMLQYLFNEYLGTFVQRLPAAEFDRVLDAVEDALTFRQGKERKSQRQECHDLLDKILDRLGGK